MEKLDDILKELSWRNLIYQQTDEEGLQEYLKENKITLYCGVDPTADSLHIGHLVPYLVLRRFQLAGHQPIVIVGCGTGMIGDPSGKRSERTLQDIELILANGEKLKAQISKVLSSEGENGVIFTNNYDWLSKITLIELLRDYGKYFNLGTMLAKESVASRLESGISFTEFTYQILQSIDFQVLFKEYNCRLQVGGSEQWGNITAGIDLIRKTVDENSKAFGLTIPLVTKADGTKFGKTESGAIWLDPMKTTPYEFYQFWFNAADSDVIKYLKLFTFLSEGEISVLARAVAEEPHLRQAQQKLAAEVTSFIHGNDALEQALRVSKALFSGDVNGLSLSEIELGFKDVPSCEITEDQRLVDLLVFVKAAASKREARDFIQNKAISINGEIISDTNFEVTKAAAIEEKLTVIRRGKKKYFLVKHI